MEKPTLRLFASATAVIEGVNPTSTHFSQILSIGTNSETKRALNALLSDQMLTNAVSTLL